MLYYHEAMNDMDSMDKMDKMDNFDRQVLLPHGGYSKLKCYQIALLVFDLTVRFVELYIDRKSRTCDQMVQAARSGKTNIAEGSERAVTSRKIELKLTGVARASLEELKLDYEDFLRQRNLALWSQDNPRRQKLVDARCQTLEDVRSWINGEASRYAPDGNRSSTPEIAANAALILLGVSNALLDRLLKRQAKDFAEKGGFTENLYQVRKNRKSNQ